MSSRAHTAVACALIVLTAGSLVRAQSTRVVPSPPAEEARRGFAVGVSLGGGALSLDVTDPARVPLLRSGRRSGLVVDGWAGWYITSRLAVMADVGGVRPRGPGPGPASFAVAIQYWPSPRVWLKSRAGVSQLDTFDPDLFPTTETGPLFGAALGVSVAQWTKASVDLSVQFAQSTLDHTRAHSVSAQVGLALWR